MITIPGLSRRMALVRNPGSVGGGPEVSFPDEGLLVVRYPRLFRPGSEEFCQELAEAAVGGSVARSISICLASATCRIEYEPGRFPREEMARRFAEAVRVAIARKAPGGSRGRTSWISLMKFAPDEGGASWETTRERGNSLRVRNPSPAFGRGEARQVADDLVSMPGVESCRVTLLGHDLDVGFDPERVSLSLILSAADRAFRRILHPVPSRLEGSGEKTPAVASGLRRLGYLALAGGSFGLTLTALVIPGVPTIPFLLATSYYLVRSSPKLNRRLLESKFFGPILADLELSHGLRKVNKYKLIGFTVAVGVVTLILSGPSLPIVLVMVGFTSISIYAITRIPGIPADKLRGPSSVPVALPA